MRQLMRNWFVLPILLLTACTLTTSPDDMPSATATILTSPVFPPAATATPIFEPAQELLITETAPYSDATYLLDGVCFDFLAAQHGQTWVWSTTSDLDQFYAAVDQTDLCSQSALRQTFDFAQSVLVGTTRTAVGCDAAYTVRDTVQDDTTQRVTLYLDFQVRSGCPYDLVEPLLLSVPIPPSGYTIQLAIRPDP